MPSIEVGREEDGRWIAEIPELPGALVYGTSREEAVAKAEALALRVLAERVEYEGAAPRSAGESIARAQALFRRYVPEGRMISDELICDRRKEADREDEASRK